jgi:hypothetical protein
MVGKTFAHYLVPEKAGAGAMGVVFRAREVALKLRSSNTLTEADSRGRLLREKNESSSLTHWFRFVDSLVPRTYTPRAADPALISNLC